MPVSVPVAPISHKALPPPISVPAVATPLSDDVRPAALPPATIVPASGGAIPHASTRGGKAETSDSAGMQIEVGKGTLLRLKRPAATVFVANSDTADVQVKSPSLVYVTGKAPGETVLYAVDEQEQVLFSGTIHVVQDLVPLRTALKQMMPDEPIEVSPMNGTLVITGNVSSASRAEDIRALVQGFVDQHKFGGIIDHLSVITPNQVNLRVRIAEIDRNTLKEFGINWNAMLSSSRFAFGLVTGNPTAATGAVGMNTATANFTSSNASIDSVINALAQEGLIHMLAEPNLSALSGQTASFLAGGEFPVPVGSTIGTGASLAPIITIEFKKFGVSLEFTPTIIDGTRINMHVRPEVSQLSTTGQVVLEGTTIPGLSVRRADTSIELGSGESFAIAGLLQNNSEQQISKIPGIGDVPILGALFRSDQWQRNETELVIIVTPYLVRPTSAMALVAPTDGLRTPNDADRVLYGASYQPGLAARGASGPKLDGTGLIGPAGFLFE
jgi:pilus assembly protein CpaC